jgi:hypothetical protein
MSLFTSFHFSVFFILRDTLDYSNKYNNRVRVKMIRWMIMDEWLTAGMVEVTMIVELLHYTSVNTCVRTGLEYVPLVCGRFDSYWTSTTGFTVISTETGLLYLNKLCHQQSTPAILQGWYQLCLGVIITIFYDVHVRFWVFCIDSPSTLKCMISTISTWAWLNPCDSKAEFQYNTLHKY